jgi:cytochrome c553
MKQWGWKLGALGALLVWSVAAGAAKSDFCAHCHGTDGNSSSSTYPSLAGQTKEYLFRQMKDFKDGRRTDPQMTPSIAVLTEPDMQELADYFSSQTLTRGSFKPDPAQAAAGKKLAEERLCATCHQASYKGLNEFPRLTRQKFSYLVKQMKDFRDGKRTNDKGAMAASLKDLSDDQIQSLAHYLTSL